ncbi:LOW QUALITY PROTEIN: HLA class II histocompatibility antigen, DR alpha chain-like [Pterocles gutturalis]
MWWDWESIPRATPAPRLVPLSLRGARRGDAGGRGVPLALLAVLTLQGAGAVKVGNTIHQAEFQQRLEPLQQEDGEFQLAFNADEMFRDLQKQETVWRLPEFGNFAGFEAQGALQNAAIGKYNLEVMMERSNRSQGTIVPPEVMVFPKRRVELGDPNILICYVDKFWPSVISITWLRNGQEVKDGVLETVFYRGQERTFRKFSYLPFIPTRGDYYDCRVEHEGLHALLKHWAPRPHSPSPLRRAQVPLPASESTETLVCALGRVGIVSIIVGTILIIKAMKMNSARNGGTLCSWRRICHKTLLSWHPPPPSMAPLRTRSPVTASRAQGRE